MIKTLFIFLVFFVNIIPFAHGEEPGQKFQGFNLEGYTESGEKSWDVNGDTADVNGTEIILSNVNANSYGDQPMNVTAEKGAVDQVSGNMQLEKDVIITSKDGSQLMTDSLNWNKKEDLVTTDDDVFISDDRFTASGTGVKAQPGLKNAQINKDVTVRVDTDPADKNDKKLTITSDGPMEIDQLLSKARFQDNVVAIQADRTLKADVMEVFFDEGMTKMKKMICTGNVVIIQGENKTYAEKAVYNMDIQKLTLSGRPKLILLTEGEGGIASIGN